MAQNNRREPLPHGRRIPITINLDSEAYALLIALATKAHTSRSAIIEDSIRAIAKRRGIESEAAVPA